MTFGDRTFALQVLRRLDLGFHGAAMNLGDQDFVVKLVDFQRNIIFGLVRALVRSLQFGLRDLIRGHDFHQSALFSLQMWRCLPLLSLLPYPCA